MKQLSFLTPKESGQTKQSSQNQIKLKLFVDGASRGNPGQSSVGMACSEGKKAVFEEGFFIGNATNNFAEYCALLTGLFLVNKNFEGESFELEIFSDSELMVCQILGKYKIRNEALYTLKTLVDEQLKNISWKIKHIDRSKNKLADSLANKAFVSKKPLPITIKNILKKVF